MITKKHKRRALRVIYASQDFNTFLQALTYVSIWREDLQAARDYLDGLYKTNPKAWGDMLRTKIKLYKGGM